jgi:hypothetical protein
MPAEHQPSLPKTVILAMGALLIVLIVALLVTGS